MAICFLIVLFLVDPNIKDIKISLCFLKTLFRIRYFCSLVSNRNKKDIGFFPCNVLTFDEEISSSWSPPVWSHVADNGCGISRLGFARMLSILQQTGPESQNTGNGQKPIKKSCFTAVLFLLWQITQYLQGLRWDRLT